MKKTIRHNMNMLAKHAQKRVLDGRSFREEVDAERARIADVASLCIIQALSEHEGLSAGEINDVVKELDSESRAFNDAKKVIGVYSAEKKLQKESSGILPGGFLLPAAQELKSNKDWEKLISQRQAAERVALLYARAIQKQLDYGPERIKAVMERAKELYLEGETKKTVLHDAEEAKA